MGLIHGRAPEGDGAAAEIVGDVHASHWRSGHIVDEVGDVPLERKRVLSEGHEINLTEDALKGVDERPLGDETDAFGHPPLLLDDIGELLFGEGILH